MNKYLIFVAAAPWLVCSCSEDNATGHVSPRDAGTQDGAGGSTQAGGAQGSGAGNVATGGKGSGGKGSGGTRPGTGGKAGGTSGSGGAQGSGGKQSGTDGGPAAVYATLPYRGLSMAGAEFGPSYGGLFNGTDIGTIPGAYYYPTSDLAKGGPNWPKAANGTAIETDLMVPYFLSKGMNTVRLPLRWERLQRSLSTTSSGVMKGADVVATFDAAELAVLQESIKTLTDAGYTVLIDIHNYALYTSAASIASSKGGNPLGSMQAPNVAFENLWIGLASLYANDPKVVFDIMNEPVTPPDPAGKPAGYEWYLAAQAAVTGIRSTGANNLILICGNNFAGPGEFAGGRWSDPLKDIQDPGNNFAFEVHDYPDDGNGGSNTCTSTSVNSVLNDLKGFVTWAKQYKARGFLGEFSGGIDVNAVPMCITAMGQILTYLEQNSDVFIGWTYWAAGAGFGSKEPLNYPFFNGMKDSPQLQALAPFLK